MDQPDREVEQQFSQPWRQIVSMLRGAWPDGAWRVHGAAARVAGLRGEPLSERLHHFRLFDRRRRLFLAGVPADRFGPLDREFRARSCREPRGQAAALLLAPLATLLRQRGKRMQIAIDSARSIQDIGCAAHRRGPRDHALYRQPSDFPRPSRHVLWPCHHRSRAGRDDPRPCPARGRRGRRGVHPPDDGSCSRSWAGWAWPLPRPFWALPGR